MVTSKPRFFKILLPGTFETQLGIPSRFVRRTLNPEGAHHDAAILCGPSSKRHLVGIHRHLARLCFSGSGWGEFVQGNDVAVGYLLVFYYEGDAAFSVEVFDHSGCSMESSGSGTMRDPRTARPTPPPDTSTEVASSNELTFAKVITFKYQIQSYMRPPKAFCVSAGLTHPCEVQMQMVGEPMVWKVNFGMSRHNHRYFAKGWQRFCEAHGVEVGDKCVFTMVEKNRLQVQLVKRGAGASSGPA